MKTNTKPLKKKEADCFGFTLVELLVVIAIIGILIALLLPAVQAAREAARRMTCSNKLHQIGIAVHNYHSAHASVYPPSGYRLDGANPASFSRRVSGFVALLPFLEQNPLYQSIVSDNYAPDFNADDPGAYDYMRTTLDPMICPSDGGGRSKAANEQSRNNYRLCSGDYPVHSHSLRYHANSLTADHGVGVGVICIVNRGAFGMHAWNGFSIITDGTSNTVLASERCIAENNRQSRQGYVGTGWNPFGTTNQAARVPATLPTNADIDKCFNMKGAGGELPVTAAAAIAVVDRSGKRWSDGALLYTGFNTILPPNAASCVHDSQNAAYSDRTLNAALITPSSNHSGGVNVAMVDGSVQFISDTIDYHGNNGGTNIYGQVYSSGRSAYGVWGAMGSRNGEESVSQ